MPTHKPHKNRMATSRKKIDASKGYEATDVRVSGVLVFLVALSIFAVVTAVLAYGIGKVLNARMAKEDGPREQMGADGGCASAGQLCPPTPSCKNKMAELTQSFPTPRLQTDDGNQDVTDLHAREDLLLDNYSWVDQSQGKVQNSHRARDGVDCPAGVAGGAGGGSRRR